MVKRPTPYPLGHKTPWCHLTLFFSLGTPSHSQAPSTQRCTRWPPDVPEMCSRCASSPLQRCRRSGTARRNFLVDCLVAKSLKLQQRTLSGQRPGRGGRDQGRSQGRAKIFRPPPLKTKSVTFFFHNGKGIYKRKPVSLQRTIAAKRNSFCKALCSKSGGANPLQARCGKRCASAPLLPHLGVIRCICGWLGPGCVRVS